MKHATPFDSNWTLEQEAKDAWFRGLADALIISGSGTGAPAKSTDLERIRQAVPDAPLIVGSGVRHDTYSEFKLASAWIVGTAFKRDGIIENEVELMRVLELSHSSSEAGMS